VSRVLSPLFSMNRESNQSENQNRKLLRDCLPNVVYPVLLLAGLFLASASPARALVLQAQFPGPRKPDKNAQKNLTGQVVDKDGKGLAQAIVYLKDQTTQEITTHISDERGDYQFYGLDPNKDYEVHAELKGSSSPKRMVSSFDPQKNVYLVLEIAPPK